MSGEGVQRFAVTPDDEVVGWCDIIHHRMKMIWRDSKSDGSLLAVPARIRGRKGDGDRVTVEFTYEEDKD